MNNSLGKIIFFSYCLLLMGTLLAPSSNIPKVEIIGFDKLAHVIVFGILSFLMLKFWFRNESDRKSISYTFYFSVSYGILLEILQRSSFSQREFDIFDLCANIIGAIAGITVFLIFKK